MPFNYKPIKVQAALRLAQLIGADQATLEAAYAGAWADALDGAEIPISSFRDVAMMVGKEIATVIGNNPNHPARSMLYGRSANQTSLENTPTVDINGVEWVGVFDAIIDVASGKPMTSQPPQTIEDLNDPFFNDTVFLNYSQFGNQVQTVAHNVPLFYYQGCIWDNDSQVDLWDADGACPLPQACANTLVNGLCAYSGQIGWTDGAGEVQRCNNLYQMGLTQLQTGLPNVPLASMNQVAG